MPSIRPLRMLVVALIVCFCLAGTASADIIVTRPGAAGGTVWSLNPSQGLAVSWTLSFPIYNVEIDLFHLNAESALIDFSLRSGTIIGDVVATASTTVTGAMAEVPLVWDTAPLTLGAGDYFLVGIAREGGAVWLGGTSDGTAVPGAFLRETDYWGVDPNWNASALRLGFQVSGDLEASGAVPEPATWALMGTGLLMLGGILRRRRS